MKDGNMPLGLYIHVPFCDKKCAYCDFLSSPASKDRKKAYVEALLAEIKSYKGVIKEYLVKTIFIGGGTPSSIKGEYIQQIIEEIKNTFTLAGDEITIEANPGTLNKEKLDSYKTAGINRLSIGLQSADNEELKLLGRIHTYEEFLKNYELARSLGFSNINVDLISSLPGQKLEDWLKTLETVVGLSPEHISAYSLILEEGTPFYNRYTEDDQDEDLDRNIYKETKKYLESKGYYRYEISNFAKSGFECKHNLSYWKRTPYLGLGLGASSLFNHTRFHNEENLNQYIKLSQNHNNIRRNIEHLTIKDEMEEFMFLGLRTSMGVRKEDFKEQFEKDIESVYGNVLNQSEKEGLIVKEENRIFLTDYGFDVSNLVMSRFLLD